MEKTLLKDLTAQMVSHPLVLRAAYERVRHWYTQTEWRPEPGLSSFRLEPESLLRDLGTRLRTRTYRPAVFRLVPYPKKGASLRHFCLPSAEDQIVFTAFGILLAPFLERVMPSFAFGNRWYRGLVRDRSQERPRWRERPFAFDNSNMYQSYRRDYAMFRRVCHWTASAMVGEPANGGGATGRAVGPEEYDARRVPEFCRSDWWSTRDVEKNAGAIDEGKRVGYWGRVDLQLAYPSVDIRYLKKQLALALNFYQENQLYRNEDVAVTLLSSYPTLVSKKLNDIDVRLELADWLTDLLASVRYDRDLIGDSWVPYLHMGQRLPTASDPEHPGLPTGLTISGLLLNAYLHTLDRHMSDWTERRPAGSRVAFLRFADDMVVIAQDVVGVVEGIDAVWRGIEGHEDAILSRPRSDIGGANLRVNWSKTEPAPLADLLKEYLEVHGWVNCEICKQRVRPPVNDEAVQSFGEWVGVSGKDLESAFATHEVSASRLGPFVTYLVERLSAIGTDSLETRFGAGVRERFIQLHELVRYRLDDRQVRTDTRLAFAVNRLSRAWLPEEGSEADATHIWEIRRSVREAVVMTPWKFDLWRAVVRAACRRPFQSDLDASKDAAADRAATEWLSSMVKLIALDSVGSDSWINKWPEQVECTGRRGNDLKQVRGLVLSFLRATFWYMIASAIRDLERAENVTGQGTGESYWSPDSWTFRSLDERNVSRVRRWISGLGAWYKVMYGNSDMKLPWWEADAIATAVLSTVSRERLIDAMQLVGRRSVALDVVDRVVVPGRSVTELDKRLLSVLRQSKRLVSDKDVQGFRARNVWSLLLLGSKGHGSDRRVAHTTAARFSAPIAAMMARTLEVSSFLPVAVGESARRVYGSLIRQPVGTRKYIYDLAGYSQIRRLWLGGLGPTLVRSQGATIHRVLWGDAERGEDLKLWTIRPWAAPVIGLPIRVALAMLKNALEHELRLVVGVGVTAALTPPEIPIWKICDDVMGHLSWGRRNQIGELGVRPADYNPPKNWILVGGQNEWEVLPHALFLFLRAVGSGEPGSFIERVWCHFLLFFTVIDGCENFLDSISKHWPSAVPFEERWDLRARIPLTPEVWKSLDEAMKGCLVNEPIVVRMYVERLLRECEQILEPPPGVADFEWERVDTLLSIDEYSIDLPRGSVPMFTQRNSKVLDEKLRVNDAMLASKMRVRIGQVSVDVDWARYADGFGNCGAPDAVRFERQAIMQQIWAVFSSRDGGRAGVSKESCAEGPIVFPELTLPRAEFRARTMQRQVESARRAALIGTLFAVLPTVVLPRVGLPRVTKYLVNEALLVVPLVSPTDSKIVSIRDFVVRKPIPTHAENALASVLSGRSAGNARRWRMIGGSQWHRFVHPNWGDFTIAICSDLIDPAPWHSMRGETLHLFVCAHNKDVQLYEQLTWVRAYESQVNLVAVNHGTLGGSFVWTPVRSDGKEIARLRGVGLFLIADVELHVKDLVCHQRIGVEQAIKRAERDWGLPERSVDIRFKSPSPRYPGRPV